MEIVTKDIPVSAISNHAYINDPEIIFENHVTHFTSLAEEYKIPKPYFENFYNIKPLI